MDSRRNTKGSDLGIDTMQQPMIPPEIVPDDLPTTFNKINEHLGIEYKETIYDDFVSMYDLVVKRLQK